MEYAKDKTGVILFCNNCKQNIPKGTLIHGFGRFVGDCCKEEYPWGLDFNYKKYPNGIGLDK